MDKEIDLLWAVGTSLSSHTKKGTAKGVVIVKPTAAASASSGSGDTQFTTFQ
jgi:hypothetical protein